jgi:YegS/Rv2252/BmrU family lipid kinase
MLSLIVNPASGGGRAGRALPGVRAALGHHGLEHRVELTLDLPHARDLALAAVTAGEMPVAFGGDGLVAAVAGALVDSDAVLGVLPGGRGNDFARCLGLPLDPVQATAVLAHGAPAAIDMGAAGDRSFLGIATCGFDSEANRIANSARLIRGRFVYTYGGLRALAGWKPASFTLRVDGIEHAVYGYTVAVANAAMHGGGMLLAPDASLHDRTLDVVMIADLPKRTFLRMLPTVFKGAHVQLDEVTIVRGTHVEISADRPFTVYADGDPLAVLPATFSVLPAAVQVMAPARAPAAPDGRNGSLPDRTAT